MHVSGRTQFLFDHFLHVGGELVIRQRRREAMEQRVWLQRQVIDRQVIGAERERGIYILFARGEHLIRQREHQIEINVVEIHLRDFDCA